MSQALPGLADRGLTLRAAGPARASPVVSIVIPIPAAAALRRLAVLRHPEDGREVVPRRVALFSCRLLVVPVVVITVVTVVTTEPEPGVGRADLVGGVGVGVAEGEGGRGGGGGGGEPVQEGAPGGEDGEEDAVAEDAVEDALWAVCEYSVISVMER